MLGAVAIEPIDLQDCWEFRLTRVGGAGEADGDGDGFVHVFRASFRFEGNLVLVQGRIEVFGAVVKGHFVALPCHDLPGRDGTWLARGAVDACGAQEELTGFG